jgi:hypothetical protein
MTTATEQTDRIFTESVLAGDAGGYPDGVSFIARDLEGWEGLVWRSLVEEGRPTVVVDEDALEILFVPVDRPALLAWFDRARGRMPVRIEWRQRGGSHAYQMPVSLSRSRLAEIEPHVAALA